MLHISDFSVTYKNGFTALKEVNLSLEEGKLYGIIGPSGAGKSSFIKGILGIIPKKGEVTFRGNPLKKFAKEIAYIEQKDNFDHQFPITVFQCVLMGTYAKLGLFHWPKRKEKKKVEEALEKVGLSAFKHRQIGELSGGQFQRVLIARSLVQDAQLFFLDEPFVGIDVHNEAVVIELLKNLQKEGKTIFVIHHGLNNVTEYFDEIIMINERIIAYGTTEETLNKENFNKTFKLFEHSVSYLDL